MAYKTGKVNKNAAQIDINSILKSAINQQFNAVYTNSQSGLVDIITFTRDFLKIDFKDRPYLKLILKMFYMNTPGNENLEITDDDIDLIRRINNYKQQYPPQEHDPSFDYDALDEFPNGNPWLLEKAMKIRNGVITKPFQTLVLVLGRRAGKAGAIDSKILTPNGWKRMGDIKVGDYVISVDGNPTRVTGVFPQGEKDIYSVTMNDGASTECCGEHLWFTYDKSDRKNGFGRRCPSTQEKYSGSVKSTLEIKNSLLYCRPDGKKERNHQIPMVSPVVFDSKEVPLDPYVLGALIGDGNYTHGTTQLTCADEQIVNTIRENLPANVKLIRKKSRDIEYYFRANDGKSIRTILKQLGIHGEKCDTKRIPECYKVNSVPVRTGILQGLMDTNGTVDHRRGKLSYCTVSEHLAKDIQYLVQSLGGTATINVVRKHYVYLGERKLGKPCYSLQINLPSGVFPFRLKRKADIYQKYDARRREPMRMIDSVEYVGKKQAQCISVAHPSRLYVTDDFIVTHNTYCASIIIAYESYKLLAMNICPRCTNIQPVAPGEYCPDCLVEGERIQTGRHPQSYYGLSGSEPIRILLAATRLGQAVDPGLMFFKERIRTCAYFDGKYLPEAESVYFRSDYDKAMNDRLVAQGLPAEKGSVKVMAVASNPNGLHGLGSSVVLLDEFALFNTEGKDTDSAFLEALLPQVLKYRKKGDGRIIMISMPDKEQGEFWEHYCKAQEHDEKADRILMMQMPTWEFTKNETREGCQEILATGSEKETDGISFDKLFGAQFQNSGGENYFPDILVEQSFNNHDNLFRVEKPVNHQHRYFMHIDCAFNSDNYAYCIMHMERRFCPQTQKMEPYFVQDDSYFWTPNSSPQFKNGGNNEIQMFVGEKGEVIDIYGILDSIAVRAKTFRCQAVSYDTIQSVESISYFRSRGLTLRQISFAGQNKSRIYQIARMALHGQRLILCNDDRQLRKEMRELKVSFTRRGPVISKPENGSDDVVDCCVGAIYMSNQKITKQFARPMAIMTGVPNVSSGGVGLPAMHGANGMPAGGRLMGAGQSLFTRFDAMNAYNGGNT